MTKWEYLVVDRRKMSLNERGEDGWELVAVTEDEHYFKRPVSPDVPEKFLDLCDCSFCRERREAMCATLEE